jgi:hypothetical protein
MRSILNVVRKNPCDSYNINDISVPNVEDLVDLRVTVYRNMRFEKHVANAVS